MMILVPYNPGWVGDFANLKAVYEEALGDLIVRVEHVGSTAIPGICAKPILDIDLVMPGYEVFPQIVERLGELGYRHNGDQGIRGREAFNVKDGLVPYTEPRREWMVHHLYVCPEEGTELRRHVVFREALRTCAEWREEYARMKVSIAERAGEDRKTYAQIKEVECRGFVERVLKEWGR